MALKSYKPVTPSLRQLVLVDRSGLHKGKPVKSLTEGKHNTGGRNNHGHITGPHRGESHFELTQQDARFTGRGSRVYSRTVDGQVTRCRVSFDTLLKRIDR